MNSQQTLSLLALDVGTHAVKTVLFSEDGEQLFRSQKKISLTPEENEKVEQDGEEVLIACEKTLKEAVAFATENNFTIRSAGICAQRSSVIAWEKDTGKPLSPVLSWQDTRASGVLNSLKEHEEKIAQKTGLRLSPHYGASKLRWLLANNRDVKQAQEKAQLSFGPLSSFLTFHLTKEKKCVADYGNAARTLLWNLSTKNWDSDLLELFQIPLQCLPECVPNLFFHGTLEVGEIPLTALHGDQNAAIYGMGELSQNEALVNCGTGAFMVLSTGDTPISSPPLLTSVGGCTKKSMEYILEGTVNGAGATLSWAEEKWGYSLKDVDSEKVSSPPVLVNGVGGIGSPWWKSGISPHFLDEPEQVTAEAIKASIIESIAFMLATNFILLSKVRTIESITISGGVSNDDSLCQKLANLIGVKVKRTMLSDLTARGIAFLAGKTSMQKDWKRCSFELFSPKEDSHLRERYEQFRKVVDEL